MLGLFDFPGISSAGWKSQGRDPSPWRGGPPKPRQQSPESHGDLDLNWTHRLGLSFIAPVATPILASNFLE